MKPRTILAYKIVSEPEIIEGVKHKYQIIFDRITEGQYEFEYINEAICILADKGWRCVSMTSTRTSGRAQSEHYIFALMERRGEVEKKSNRVS